MKLLTELREYDQKLTEVAQVVKHLQDQRSAATDLADAFLAVEKVTIADSVREVILKRAAQSFFDAQDWKLEADPTQPAPTQKPCSGVSQSQSQIWRVQTSEVWFVLLGLLGSLRI